MTTDAAALAEKLEAIARWYSREEKSDREDRILIVMTIDGKLVLTTQDLNSAATALRQSPAAPGDEHGVEGIAFTEIANRLRGMTGMDHVGETAHLGASAIETLLAENAALSAGQCIVDGGLLSGAGGSPYCSLALRAQPAAGVVPTPAMVQAAKAYLNTRRGPDGILGEIDCYHLVAAAIQASGAGTGVDVTVLHVQQKEGWTVVTSPAHPGLYVAHRDEEVAMKDALPALKYLLQLDAAKLTEGRA